MISSTVRPRAESMGRARRSQRATLFVGGLLAAGAVVGLATVPAAAETPAPVVPGATVPGVPVVPGATVPGAPVVPGATVPGAPVVPGATVPGARTAVAQPPNSAPGGSVTVAGTGWPAGAVVVANICGNSGLNPAADCTPTPAGQNIAGVDGAVVVPVIVAAPVQPCPCVIRLSVAGDPTTADAALIIDGATTPPPGTTAPQSSVDVNARITGSGPLSAYFGGAAQRDVIVSVTNTGTTPLINPVLVLTFGKGQEPTEVLLGPGGQPAALGTIAPGQTVDYQQPVTLEAPAFGQYRLLGRFEGIATVTVNGTPQSQLTFTATTTSYPWFLILGGWLLLQIPLIGLYKRRTTTPAAGDDDPYLESFSSGDPPADRELAPVGAAEPVAAAAVAVAAAPAVAAPAAPSAVAPALPTDAPPLPAGFQLVDPPVSAEPVAAEPEEAAPVQDEPETSASPVFGVNDLRSMLDR